MKCITYKNVNTLKKSKHIIISKIQILSNTSRLWHQNNKSEFIKLCKFINNIHTGICASCWNVLHILSTQILCFFCLVNISVYYLYIWFIDNKDI